MFLKKSSELKNRKSLLAEYMNVNSMGFVGLGLGSTMGQKSSQTRGAVLAPGPGAEAQS